MENNLRDWFKEIIREVIAETMSETKKVEPEQKEVRMYTREQASEKAHISLTTFHSLVNQGLIPIVKVGRRTLVNAEEFDGLLATGTICRYKHARRS